MSVITRQEALEKGLLFYNTGKPCMRGHISDRRVSNFVCMECINVVHKPKFKQRQRKYALKAYYGITPQDYTDLLRAQGGRCAICGSSSPNDRRGHFHVDHCHTSKEIRGLLCQPCNMGLGLFKDSPEVLEKAIGYLKNSLSKKERE